MRRILMVMDSNDLNTALIQFGCAVAKFSHAKLFALYIGQENSAGLFKEQEVKPSGSNYNATSDCDQEVSQGTECSTFPVGLHQGRCFA